MQQLKVQELYKMFRNKTKISQFYVAQTDGYKGLFFS